MTKMEPEAFIEWVGPAAANACKEWNIPASVQIAQAILESGWGASCIGEYNLFGIKYYGAGGPITVDDVDWADFSSLQEACDKQAKMIARPDGNYTVAMQQLPDKVAYIEAMASVYAPASDGNVDYANKIINICNSWDLWKWDDPSMAGKVVAANIKGDNATAKSAKPSDDGFSIKNKPHGKHADSEITKLPKGKTFCEPVYPDLVTVSDKIPQWLLDQVNIPKEKLQADNMLVYTIPTQVLKDACGGDLDAILGSAEDAKECQRLFDPNNYKKESKKRNPGKPANNNEPFPVDLKIEELETHKPTVKIHTITTCPEAVNVAKAVINVSDRAEKRIVKLENVMATMLRYLFRLSSRVHINCVYYGGQTPFEKYNCIRCLKDDRLSDGQMMSMDQCLNCTRYEPIIGQLYEIMNDLGANLASILDDNQMSYMDMRDYVDFTRVEKFQKEREKAKIDMATVTTRNATEKDFKDMWPKGIEMDWNLVPVEEQKAHVNWRQSIQDDGSKMKRLASFPMDEKNAGTPITAKSANVNIMQKNADAMNRNTNTVIQPQINTGKNAANVTDELINRMKGGLEKEIRSKLNSNTDVDPLIIASIMQVEGATDPAPIIQRYSEVMTSLQIKNPAIVISAYKVEATTFLGDETVSPKLPRIDKVTKPDPANPNTPSMLTFNLNWDSRETWLWTDFCEPMELNLKAINAIGLGGNVLAFFPQVCYVYVELARIAKTSRFDGDEFAFPFFEEQLNGVWYVSKYGERQLPSESAARMHWGIDLATGPEGAGMEIHAIADGVVVVPSDWEPWNAVIIEHANEYYSRYLHNSSICVSAGQVVKKGDVVAGVGDTASGGAFHLHLEIGRGDPLRADSLDPIDYYPLLADKFGDGADPIGK